MTSGQRLKQLFAYLGLNQQEVADRFGIERSLISKLYNDKQSISKLFMFALKAEFGANPEWILSGKGEMFLAEKISMSMDVDLMQKVIEGVESIFKKNKWDTSPAKKAEIIIYLYNEASKSGTKEFEEKAIRLIKLAI